MVIVSKDDWIKALTIIGPLLASSIAIMYDVGFFFGADIAFFTFFSLSEHIVFALQAIPFALPIALAVTGFILSILWGYRRIEKGSQEAVALASTMTADEKQKFISDLTKSSEWYKKTDPWVQLAITAVAVGMLTVHLYAMAAMTIISQIISKMVYPVERLGSRNLRIALGVTVVASGWLLAFVFGMERAQHIAASKTPTEKIFVENSILAANVVRAGDRGVLFYTYEPKQLTFLSWTQIKKIVSF